MSKKTITVLTGAGISAESGINTFRGSDGLWEGHDVMDVASPGGWQKNKALVLDFYNQRRQQLQEVEPNDAHKLLAQLEDEYDVNIVTQNVDDLHERGGSTNIVHLHGELLKVRSTLDARLVYDWKEDVTLEDKCEKGSQLRPHIVWFGEDVPLLSAAAEKVYEADILVIIGTSMQVYPAAGLVNYASSHVPIYFIDPNPAISERDFPNLTIIKDVATRGVRKFVNLINGK